ncbi:MAG: glycerol-3-phosphate dehydrogenase [Rhodobacterales bacterium]|nr:MAG: glycerol-3-phosphate dehydrogenase [Rhodobacterales bacterium]
MTAADFSKQPYDLFIIGGGVNGCGIARDAAGRGLSVMLAEQGDLAQATSSSSTKLFHGGLRYLEYFELSLVRQALKEREVLLQATPHISRPMRFVLPYHPDMRFENSTPASRWLSFFMPWMKGRRPAWMIRLGLFLYDHIGGRKLLPATRTVDLTKDSAGAPLQDKYRKAYEYSDGWVDDARLVALNARDAAMNGADIRTRCKVIRATRKGDLWHITVQGVTRETYRARALVNAGGPWVKQLLDGPLDFQTPENIRLVRGSHIVVKRLFDHDRAYFFQGQDGRIIFAIPYQTDFTLIGTTDADHPDADTPAICTEAEQDYLCAFASQYFKQPVQTSDIVWSYAGVRPLYDDGLSSASATTRDYALRLVDDAPVAPLLNIFGGKITTYRKLSEKALHMLAPFFANMGPDWTKTAPLPGGDFPFGGVDTLQQKLLQDYPFLSPDWALRLLRAYGTDSEKILQGAGKIEDLGQHFGHDLYEAEIRWLITHEFAQTAEDVLWRRSKLGLRLSEAEQSALAQFMLECCG